MREAGPRAQGKRSYRWARLQRLKVSPGWAWCSAGIVVRRRCTGTGRLRSIQCCTPTQWWWIQLILLRRTRRIRYQLGTGSGVALLVVGGNWCELADQVRCSTDDILISVVCLNRAPRGFNSNVCISADDADDDNGRMSCKFNNKWIDRSGICTQSFTAEMI